MLDKKYIFVRYLVSLSIIINDSPNDLKYSKNNLKKYRKKFAQPKTIHTFAIRIHH